MSAPLDQAPPADGASPVVPPHLQTFLALDFGIKRTGFAVGNRLMRTAQPQGTIAAEGDARFVQIAKHLSEWQPEQKLMKLRAPRCNDGRLTISLFASRCQPACPPSLANDALAPSNNASATM